MKRSCDCILAGGKLLTLVLPLEPRRPQQAVDSRKLGTCAVLEQLLSGKVKVVKDPFKPPIWPLALDMGRGQGFVPASVRRGASASQERLLLHCPPRLRVRGI